MSSLNVNEAVLYFYGTNAHEFTLHTRHLMATLYLSDTGSFPVDRPCRADDVVNLSGLLAGGQTLRHGPAYYNGKRYSKLFYEGSVAFNATPFSLPPDSALPVSIRTRFRLAGNLKAYESDNISGGGGPPVFDVTLGGNGHATANFGASYDSGSSQIRDTLALFYYCSRSHWICGLIGGC